MARNQGNIINFREIFKGNFQNLCLFFVNIPCPSKSWQHPWWKRKTSSFCFIQRFSQLSNMYENKTFPFQIPLLYIVFYVHSYMCSHKTKMIFKYAKMFPNKVHNLLLVPSLREAIYTNSVTRNGKMTLLYWTQKCQNNFPWFSRLYRARVPTILNKTCNYLRQINLRKRTFLFIVSIANISKQNSSDGKKNSEYFKTNSSHGELRKSTHCSLNCRLSTSFSV